MTVAHRRCVGGELLNESGLVYTSLQGTRVTQDVWDIAEILLLVHDWKVVLVLDQDIERASLHLLRCRQTMNTE